MAHLPEPAAFDGALRRSVDTQASQIIVGLSQQQEQTVIRNG
jgi:hypothetical protein